MLPSARLLGGGGGIHSGSSEGLGGAGGGREFMSGGGTVRIMMGVVGLAPLALREGVAGRE